MDTQQSHERILVKAVTLLIFSVLFSSSQLCCLFSVTKKQKVHETDLLGCKPFFFLPLTSLCPSSLALCAYISINSGCSNYQIKCTFIV